MKIRQGDTYQFQGDTYYQYQGDSHYQIGISTKLLQTQQLKQRL